jgi:TetR/AcrR family transcriptional regulator, regulator of autoinduction and epiphytic fitness
MQRVNVDVKRRSYRSAARVEQAQQTRRRILAAATRLFVESGYAATNIADIAAEAGVVSRTVYLDFPNKRALLGEAIGVALGGDDAPVMLRDRDLHRQMVEAPGAEIPTLFAKFAAALHVRSAALLEAAEAAAAADPELAEPRDRSHQNRRADLRRVATAIAAKTGADVDYVTDLLYTLGSSAVYALFVFQCGWSQERYESWLRETIEAAILK